MHILHPYPSLVLFVGALWWHTWCRWWFRWKCTCRIGVLATVFPVLLPKLILLQFIFFDNWRDCCLLHVILWLPIKSTMSRYSIWGHSSCVMDLYGSHYSFDEYNYLSICSTTPMIDFASIMNLRYWDLKFGEDVGGAKSVTFIRIGIYDFQWDWNVRLSVGLNSDVSVTRMKK